MTASISAARSLDTPPWRMALARWMPRLVVAPTFALAFAFIYGLIAWNGVLSVSASRLLPNYEFVGLAQYVTLFESERWMVALKNLVIFSTCLLYTSPSPRDGLLSRMPSSA